MDPSNPLFSGSLLNSSNLFPPDTHNESENITSVFVKYKKHNDKANTANLVLKTNESIAHIFSGVDLRSSQDLQSKLSQEEVYPIKLILSKDKKTVKEAIFSSKLKEKLSKEDLKEVTFSSKINGQREYFSTTGMRIGTMSKEEESVITRAFAKYLDEYRAVKNQLEDTRTKSKEEKDERVEGYKPTDQAPAKPRTVADHIRGRLEKQQILKDVSPRMNADKSSAEVASADKASKKHKERVLDAKHDDLRKRIDKENIKDENTSTDMKKDAAIKKAKRQAEGLPPEKMKSR